MTTPYQRSIVIVIMFMGTAISCVSSRPMTTESSSIPSGANDAIIKVFVDGQRTIPEYGVAIPQVMVSAEVIVSSEENDLQSLDLAKAIVGANAELVLITPTAYFEQKGLEGPTFKDLRTRLGRDIKKVKLFPHQTASISPWSRDFAPEVAKTTKAGGQDYRLIDFTTAPSEYGEQGFLAKIATQSGKPRINLPLLQEGGNFMINDSGHCLMTEKIFALNHVGVATTEALPSLSREQIIGYFQHYLGCSKVTILPLLPYEESGHIDVFAKFLSNDTILLHEMRDDTIATITAKDFRVRAKQMQKFLAEQKKVLAGMGFKVVTVPMPAPYFTLAKVSADQYEEYKIIRSYTNGLILGRTLIIPQYVMNFSAQGEVAWSDSDLIPGYEQEMGKAAEEAGYKPVYVNADKLIQLGGSIHAVAKGLPAKLL